MEFFYKTFLRGLFAVLPVAITIYLFIWLFSSLESVFRPLLIWLLPRDWYMPGMGMAIGLAGIFLIGLLLHAWFVRWLWQQSENAVNRMPLVKHIYGSVKQVFSYISGADRPEGQQAVMVRVGDPPVRMLGLVTIDDFKHKPETSDDKLLGVFLPWSYQFGGFTVYVPKAAIEPVDLSPEQALRLTLTAGVGRKKSGESPPTDTPG